MGKSLPIKDLKVINLIKSFYKKKNNDRDLLFFLLAINTGLKINEILDLNISDIKGKDNLIVKQCVSKIKKRIPLNDEIKELVSKLAEKRKGKEPLFISIHNKRLSRNHVYEIFKSTCEELGLDDDISIASLRKTFGYHYYQEYRDLAYLQWLFNQATIISTMKYIDINEDLSFRFNPSFSL